MLHYFLGIIKQDKPLLLGLDRKTPTYWRFPLTIAFHLRLSYMRARREDLVPLRLSIHLSIREDLVSRSFCTRLFFFFYFHSLSHFMSFSFSSSPLLLFISFPSTCPPRLNLFFLSRSLALFNSTLQCGAAICYFLELNVFDATVELSFNCLRDLLCY